MKPRTVLVLAGLVAVLAAFIWFVERDLPSSDERAELAGRLLAVEPEEVTGLSAEWQGTAVRLERRGDEEGAASSGWWLAEPMNARADGAAVDRLVEALVGLDKKRSLEEADLQAVGLDPPRGTVTLRAGDREWTVAIGADVPTSDDLLVSLVSSDAASGGSGSPDVCVTSSGFLDQLGREPGAWRARDPFPAVQGAVERLTLETPPGAAPVVLERRDERFWIEQPFSDLADADRVDDLLDGLTGLRVTEFVDDLPASGADLGLAEPRLTIEALLAGVDAWDGGEVPSGEPFRLELGADGEASGTVYARADGQVFTTFTDLVALGTVPAEAWRSPAWTGLRSFEIDGVQVTDAEGSFSLARDGIDWQRDGETLPYGVVDDLLSAVTGARGEVVADRPPGDEEAPSGGLTLSITRKDGDPVTLTLHEASGGGEERTARSSERLSAVRLPADVVAAVLDAVTAVRDAQPEAPEAPAEVPADF